jgi:hypothetical protein
MFDWPLTPPKQVTLLVSLILAIFACLVQWLHLVATQWLCDFGFRLPCPACRKRVSGCLSVWRDLGARG